MASRCYPRAFSRLTSSQVSPSVLSDSAGLILRLQVLAPGDPDLLRAIDLALRSVIVLESNLRIRDGTCTGLGDRGPDLRFKHLSGDDSLALWGKIIATLWRVIMGFNVKPSSWDGLTLRLLVWRSIAGERGTTEGEWARREVVCSLRSTYDA